MATTSDVTPAAFKPKSAFTCPSIHKHENGDYILIGTYVSLGEIANMNIPEPSANKAAIRLSREFIDAFFMEYAAKKILDAK